MCSLHTYYTRHSDLPRFLRQIHSAINPVFQNGCWIQYNIYAAPKHATNKQTPQAKNGCTHVIPVYENRNMIPTSTSRRQNTQDIHTAHFSLISVAYTLCLAPPPPTPTPQSNYSIAPSDPTTSSTARSKSGHSVKIQSLKSPNITQAPDIQSTNKRHIIQSMLYGLYQHIDE